MSSRVGESCCSRCEPGTPADLEKVARALLRRYGVLFRAILSRERSGVPWGELQRALRLMELRGDVHGGRFVEGFAGEQLAAPEAIPALRAAGAAAAQGEAPALNAADPLALDGLLVPGAHPVKG